MIRNLARDILPYGLVVAVKEKRVRQAAETEQVRLAAVRQEKAQRYIAQHSVRKLHLGCGYRFREGWLNTDLVPRRDEVIALDVTQRFPFADNLFDYIFSEHLIEHISYQEGLVMLAECCRVLKPSGKLRIATPNLRTLIDLCGPQRTNVQNRYIKFYVDRYNSDIGIYDEVFVINNFFRNYGHQFIYDPKTLEGALRKAGFAAITPRAVGQSDDPDLQNVECHSQDITDEFNRLETFILEGTKPA